MSLMSAFESCIVCYQCCISDCSRTSVQFNSTAVELVTTNATAMTNNEFLKIELMLTQKGLFVLTIT